LEVRRRVLVACLCVVLALTAAVVGLNRVTASFERDAKDVRKLHLAAHALLPAAKVEWESEAGCKELAAYPDCVLISFRRNSSLEQALRETTRHAAAQGWSATGEGWREPGGVTLVYERKGLRANISVDAHDYTWKTLCTGASPKGDRQTCTDYVQVRFWP
jgi:hypothetical protein